MSTNPVLEGRRPAFMRFSLAGLGFTILGPSLFWLAYPLGPFLAIAVTELSVHILRFFVFKKIVFPVHRGYTVTVQRYVVSALPVSLAGIATVAVLRDRLDRLSLTFAIALMAVVVGFLWSRFVYARPKAAAR